jgi:hypothetical protein
LPAVAGFRLAQPAPGLRVTLRLSSARPFDELTRLWCFGPARRITARAHPDWWPSRTETPERWQAWIELADGSAVRVLCQPREPMRPAGTALCATAVRLRDALRA